MQLSVRGEDLQRRFLEFVWSLLGAARDDDAVAQSAVRRLADQISGMGGASGSGAGGSGGSGTAKTKSLLNAPSMATRIVASLIVLHCSRQADVQGVCVCRVCFVCVVF